MIALAGAVLFGDRLPPRLWAGLALGLLMPVVTQIDQVPTAAITLALVGAVGGAMVVPLNALLQHRGAVLLSAGRSVAVQGFNENLSVLAMLAVYAGCEAAGVAIELTLSGLGVLVTGALLALIWRDSSAASSGLAVTPWLSTPTVSPSDT